MTRLITSASSFGRVFSDITLTINRKTGELAAASADNVIVGNALNAAGPGVTRIADPSKEDPAVAAVVQPVRHGLGPAGQPGDRLDHG